MRPLIILVLLCLPLPSQAEDWAIRRKPPSRAREAPKPKVRPAPSPAEVRETMAQVVEEAGEAGLQGLLAACEGHPEGLMGCLSWAEGRAQAGGEAGPWMVVGYLAGAAGQLARAQKAFGQAATLATQDPRPFLALARLNRSQGQREDAWSALDKAEARGGGREALEQRLDLAMEAGWADRALATAQSLASQARWRADVCVELAESLSSRGMVEQGVLLLRQAKGGGQGPLRQKLLSLQEDLHRRRDDLRSLIALYERDFPGPEAERALALGRLYEEVGDEGRALELLGQALRSRPRDQALRGRLIRLLARQGKIEEMADVALAMIPRSADDQSVMLEAGETLLQGKRKELAFRVLDRLVAHARRDKEALQRVSDMLVRHKCLAQALSVTQALARLAPKDGDILAALGEQHFQLGKRDRAVAIWRKLSLADEDRAAGQARLASILADHGLNREALEALHQALALSPQRLDLMRSLALLLERLGRRQEALDQWQKVLDACNDPAQRREARQRMVSAMGRGLRSGRSELERRFRARKPDIEAGLILAEVYAKGRDWSLARQIYHQILRFIPDHLEALWGLVQVEEDSGRLTQALAGAERLAQLHPGQVKASCKRQLLLAQRMNQTDRVLALSLRLAELSQGDPGEIIWLARLLQQVGRTVDATDMLERAVKLAPDHHQARLDLAERYLAQGRHEAAQSQIRAVLAAPSDSLTLERALEMTMKGGDKMAETKGLLLNLMDQGGMRGSLAARALTHLLALTCQSHCLERAKPDRSGGATWRALEATLAMDDPSLQAEALDVIRCQRMTVAVEAVGRLVAEASPPLALRAALTLVAIGQPGAGASLARALGSRGRKNLDRALAAAWVLGWTGGTDALVLMKQALAEARWQVRAMAALSLGRLGARIPGDSVSELVKALGDSRGEVQRAAALGLAALASAESDGTVPLGRLLASPDPLVRQAGTWAMAARGDATGLLKALWLGDGRVRALALAALDPPGSAPQNHTVPPEAFLHLKEGKFDLPRLLQALQDIPPPALTTPPDLELLAQALEVALRGLGGQSATMALADLDRPAPFLAPLLDRHIPDALGKALLPLSEGPDPLVRARAAGVLGRWGTRAAVERLARMATHDPAGPVRARAAAALGHRAGEALRQALDDHDFLVRSAATLSLAPQQAMDDPSPLVRQAALRARRQEISLEALQAALKDPNAGVRHQALGALGPEGKGLARPLTHDGSEKVRGAARRMME